MHALLALPQIITERCTGCGDCVEICHAAVLALRDLKAAIARPDRCDYCTECEAVCPARAIICPFEVVLEEPVDAPRFAQKLDHCSSDPRGKEDPHDRPCP
jgi:NAD-dependent dihydropyrimidine dehydrogenase PreA subunit